MENRISINFYHLLFITGILFIIPVFSYGYEPETTHKALTQEMIRAFNESIGIPRVGIIKQEEIDAIIQGSVDEDDGITRVFRHFYDPINGKGLFVDKQYPSSKTWAHDREKQLEFDPRKDYTWETAIYQYAWGDKNYEPLLTTDRKYGLDALGHILHLVEDASVPDHTRNDKHPPGNNSPYEHWANKFNIDNIKESLDLKNQKLPGCATLDDCFDEIAKYSNSKFFSRDTIDNKNYNLPRVGDLAAVKVGKKIYAVPMDDKTNYLFQYIIERKDFRGQSLPPVISRVIRGDDELLLRNYWDRLAPRTVLVGASVIELFFKEVENERKTQKIKNERTSTLSSAPANPKKEPTAPPAPKACVTGGCSGEACVPEGVMPITTCDINPEKICLKEAARCEPQPDGQCGWTRTPQYPACVERVKNDQQKSTPSSQTLSVSISATPPSGTAPLNGVILTATVSGSAQGTINYTFYCDRSAPETNITPGAVAKFDHVTDNPKTAVCNYPNAGAYTAKVITEQGSAPQAEARISIGVAPPRDVPAKFEITTTSLVPATATVDTPYSSAQLQATGGTSPYKWFLYSTSDPLPPGLSINKNGIIEGTPTQSGTYSFLVEAKDNSGSFFGAGQKTTRIFTLVVNEAKKPAPPPPTDWDSLLKQSSPSWDAQGFTWGYIPDSYGVTQWYRKEGNNWVQKSSEAEAQAPYSPTPTPSPKPLRCAQEVKQCPDGSYVNRTGPNCEFTECQAKEPDKPNINISELENQIHSLINVERQKQSLSILDWDSRLADIARNHSQDMATRNYFAHTRPDGCDLSCKYKKATYDFSRAAENIALRFLYKSTYADGKVAEYNTQAEIASSAVQGWMNSPGHRASILTPDFKNEGIGVAIANDGKVYITENFSIPPPTAPVCVPNWSCGNWDVCTNNQQARSCNDSNKCGDNTGQPDQTQSCTPSVQCNGKSYSLCPSGKVPYCQPSGGLQCHDPDATLCNGEYWAACPAGQTWSCSSNGGVCKVPPAPVCTPNWQTGAWGTCTNGQQTRTVTDSNSCSIATNKPAATQSCVIQPPPPTDWGLLLNQYSPSWNAKGSTWGYITDSNGVTQWYRKEGSNWVQKSSKAEAQTPYFPDWDAKGFVWGYINDSNGGAQWYRKEGSNWVQKSSEAEAKAPYSPTPTPTPAQPTATTGLPTAITSNSATLNATVNPNGVLTGAFFRWGPSSSFGNTTPSQVIGSGSAGIGVSANVAGLTPATTYYFEVLTVSSEAVYGGIQNFTTSSIPAAPTNLLVAPLSASTATMAWTDNSGDNESGFKIERKVGTTGVYAQIATQKQNLNFFNDSGLSASTQYCYRVRAYNSAGDSVYSNETCIKVP